MGEGARHKFEDILSMVGDQNKWQIIIFLFTWIEGCLIGFHHLSSSFLGGSMPHFCNVEQIDAFRNVKGDWSIDQMKEFAIPM